MQYFWLNQKQENKKLIVFFNGWGMNETPFKHIKTDDFDILFLYDYTNIEFDFNQFNFSKYKEKHLVCWSMGVYVSNLFKSHFDNFTKKIAINGTNKMIDDSFGIPKKIYNITIKLFCEKSCDKFIKNMFENEKINPNITITRTIENLKQELISIKNINFKEENIFDYALISTNDKIVPYKNQLTFWQNKAKIVEINSSHCLFEKFSNWSEILC